MTEQPKYTEIEIEFEEEVYDFVEAEAKRRNITFDEYIEYIVRDYQKRYEARLRYSPTTDIKELKQAGFTDNDIELIKGYQQAGEDDQQKFKSVDEFYKYVSQDRTMTYIEIIDKIVEMRDDRDWMQFHNPKNLAISIQLEANEILEHFKDYDNADSKTYAEAHISDIAEELADVSNYLLELAHNTNLELEKILKPTEDTGLDPKTLAINLVLEANELLECFQWKTFEESEQFTVDSKDKLQEKVRNVFIVLSQFIKHLDLDLPNIMKSKIEKNIAKYPVEKSKGSSKKYNKL